MKIKGNFFPFLRIFASIMMFIILFSGPLQTKAQDFAPMSNSPSELYLSRQTDGSYNATKYLLGNRSTPENIGNYSQSDVDAGLAAVRNTPGAVKNVADGYIITGDSINNAAKNMTAFTSTAEAAKKVRDPNSTTTPGAKYIADGKNVDKGTGLTDKAINFFIWLISFSFHFISLVVGFLIYISGLAIDFFFSANKLAGSDMVKAGWTFTRDALNFVFILVLLAISFSTIAGIETFQMRKALPSLIFAALLVNFSLAIAGAFLQISNVLTKSIVDTVLPSTGTSDSNKIGKRITVGLMNAGDIGRFYTYTDSEWLSWKSEDGKSVNKMTFLKPKDDQITFTQAMDMEWSQYLQMTVNSALSLVMICIFAAAFIFLAILMVVRLVMLVILLILSPVPFVFSIIPQAKSFADKWWSNFINYVIFLPVVTFFLALAIRILKEKPAGSPLAAQFFEGSGGAASGIAGSIFDLLFIATFVFATVLVAKSLGIAGTNAALGAAKKTTLGAAKIGAIPARLVGKGVAATGVMAGHGAAKVGLMAADAAGTGITKIPGGGSVLRGARTAGRAAQRLYKGQESREQIEEKKKALTGMGEDELRSAYERGNVAAGVKLMENDDLKKEEYDGLSARVPKGTEAHDKVKSNWKRKDPIGAVVGGDMRAKLLSTTPLNKQDQDKVDGLKDDLQSAFKKMKPEDYAKLDGDDLRAAIKAGVKVPLTKPQLDAAVGSTNTDLQLAASDHLKFLEANQALMNPGQKATLDYARNKLKMT